MIFDYLNYTIEFFAQAINWMSHCYITESVSLLYFIIGCALLCIMIGGVLIR